MEWNDMHGFPESIRAFQKYGQKIYVPGGDGIVRIHLIFKGYYKNHEGYFVFIKEPDGSIDHRMFEQIKEK